MRKQLVVVGLVLIALMAGLDRVTASTANMVTPAVYKGRVIDLAHGWNGAKACAVIKTGDVRCYSSEAEQWRELAKLRSPQPPTATLDTDVYCLNRTDLYLILYENTNYGGASLSLNIADVWHNLSSYSFDDITSSWRNNTYCTATAATGTSGAGSQLSLAARSQNADVGTTWNDVISSAYIDSTTA